MKNKLVIGGLLSLVAIAGLVGGTLIKTSVNAEDAEVKGVTAQKDETKGGHVGTNGVKEEVLTGDNAEKAKAAALGANPGGTIQRVETDAEGSIYEAHMTKSDGTRVTIKMDSDFKVTGSENGMK